MVFHNEMHLYMGLIERNESQLPSAEGWQPSSCPPREKKKIV